MEDTVAGQAGTSEWGMCSGTPVTQGTGWMARGKSDVSTGAPLPPPHATGGTELLRDAYVRKHLNNLYTSITSRLLTELHTHL